MEKAKRLSRSLFILWIVCYFIFSTGSSIYVSYQEVVNGTDPTAFGGSFQLFTLGAIVLFFIPLLAAVMHYAKLSQSNKLKGIVLILLLILIIAAVFMTVFTILSFAAPDVLSAILALNYSGK